MDESPQRVWEETGKLIKLITGRDSSDQIESQRAKLSEAIRDKDSKVQGYLGIGSGITSVAQGGESNSGSLRDEIHFRNIALLRQCIGIVMGSEDFYSADFLAAASGLRACVEVLDYGPGKRCGGV